MLAACIMNIFAKQHDFVARMNKREGQVAFVDAGLSPLAALRMATQDAATALGAGSSLGSLDVGKLADIVLLDASPLEDIHNTRTIWRVIKNGWLFDPEMLRPPESDSTTK